MLLVAALVASLFLDSPLDLALVGAAAVVEVAEIYGWIWFLRRYRVQTGAEGMVGKRVLVVAADGAEGTVRVHGEIWRARFGSARAEGDQAEVVAVDGLTVITD
jgi:membrane protein implicated in regulation of membrane protease activity